MIITRLAPLISTICALSGCGTIVNLGTPYAKPIVVGETDEDGGSELDSKSFYGGVRLDAEAGRRSFRRARENPLHAVAGTYLWGIDLPVSAIGDTLTLPVTVPVTIHRGIDQYYFPDKYHRQRDAVRERTTGQILSSHLPVSTEN